MAFTITRDNGRYTKEAEKFFEQYMESFGEVTRVTMESTVGKVEYKLTLYNKSGDVMVFENALTSGYIGAGPNAAFRVLKKCGFDITEDYVHTNERFELIK